MNNTVVRRVSPALRAQRDAQKATQEDALTKANKAMKTVNKRLATASDTRLLLSQVPSWKKDIISKYPDFERLQTLGRSAHKALLNKTMYSVRDILPRLESDIIVGLAIVAMTEGHTHHKMPQRELCRQIVLTYLKGRGLHLYNVNKVLTNYFYNNWYSAGDVNQVDEIKLTTIKYSVSHQHKLANVIPMHKLKRQANQGL